MNHAADLLVRMAGLLRPGTDWAGIDPAPVFDPAPRLGRVESPRIPLVRPDGLDEALSRVETLQPELNAFTSIFCDAKALPGPLAGVTFAVKDLFDVAGVVTLAGSIARKDDPPAVADATAIARLRRDGALLLGTTNMDEGAYGFTTENSHYGPTRNPHDRTRVAGGSSGGSAAAVAAGIVDVALGTDTNGSVRIPAAFCGVYGLRPTFGLVPRTGTVLFAPSFDTVGIFARTVAELGLVLDVVQGPDGRDHSCMHTERTAEWHSELRVAAVDLDGWGVAAPEVLDATATVGAALDATGQIALPGAGLARAAAIVITAAEGADQQEEVLRTRPELVDARVRDRFLAGLDVPAIDYLAAQRFRRHWQAQMLALLADVDVLVLPTVACAAPVIDEPMLEVAGETLPTGAVLGRFTQPLSFIGLPSLSVPLPGPDGLPLGVQLVGRPFCDGALLAAAAKLEQAGVVGAVAPPLQVDTAWR